MEKGIAEKFASEAALAQQLRRKSISWRLNLRAEGAKEHEWH
jgi:hypothetical protein